MKRITALAVFLILAIVALASAESVETWTNPNSNTKKFITRTVDTAATAQAVVRRDADGNFDTGKTLSAQYGAGALGTSDLGGPVTTRKIENGIITTTIKVDITGLACKGDAAKDAIGLAAGGAAYIGRYVVADYGVVYRVEMACLELPGEGTATITADIDLGAEDAADTAYDGAVDDVVINTASLVAGEVAVTNVPALTANDYLYLVEGDTAATTGVYNAGQYVITFYGHALLD
jgi:hypothetical protein